MPFKDKIKYAVLFALCFSILTTVLFLADIFVNFQIAPAPLAQAFLDYASFASIISIGALIFGLIEMFISLWLYTSHKRWFWPVVFVLAILLGGLFSFFSLWLIWVLIALTNILLHFVVTCFLELRQLKMPK